MDGRWQMQERERYLQGSVIALMIGAFLLTTISLTSCSKQLQGGSSFQGDQPNQASQATSFKGEVYRSQDGSVVVTMTSSEELELAKNGVNLICRYTRQAAAIRAVETVMGTSQAVNYRIIPEGIQGPDGRILYSPAALRKVTEQAKLASELAGRRAAEAHKLVVGTWETQYGVLDLRADGSGQSILKGQKPIDLTWSITANEIVINGLRSRIERLDRNSFVWQDAYDPSSHVNATRIK